MQTTQLALATLLATLSLGIQAANNPQQFERYKPDTASCQEAYTYYDSDSIVAETKTHAVVRQDAGTSCAAGSFFLINKKAKTYRAVDAGTCNDLDFSVKLSGSQLVFQQNKRITALYPIYAF